MNNFYEEFKNEDANNLNNHLMGAADNGDLEKIRYLLTSPELEHHANIEFKNYWVLKRACRSGNLDLVKYLLTSNELTKHCDINADNDAALCAACEKGHLHIVEYLLTSPDLKQHANINAWRGTASPLSWACSGGNLDIVKFLLHSPSLKEKADLHFNEDAPFYEAYCSQNWDIIKYFIFDLNIEKTKHIDFYVNVYSDNPAADWLKIREAQQELTNELDSNQTSIKKKNKL